MSEAWLGNWALVTSNYEHRVRGRFARTGLPLPTVIVDAAGVTEGKPSPIPYLRAAEMLGAAPHDCLVIEDSASGVQSGLRAGMTVWGVNAITRSRVCTAISRRCSRLSRQSWTSFPNPPTSERALDSAVECVRRVAPRPSGSRGLRHLSTFD